MTQHLHSTFVEGCYRMDRLPSGRPYCWTHHTHDPLHLAAAVVERLRGERP